MELNILISWLAPLGAAIAFLVGLFQWIDTRKRDIEQKRFEQFHRAFEQVSGRTMTGQVLVDTVQAMAVYELTNFPEYRDLSIPILEYYLHQTSGEDDSSLFRRALLHAQARLTQ
ncbi:hypothetical protein [Chitinimonas taiwanensis]|uniref:hypothetical protein n=1 Tax=Chitinimonas taiwanensis TaxID=240412 RepID=UPI0009309DD8|nr:hypothetical protein [Chitinimonas taiwanensis]